MPNPLFDHFVGGASSVGGTSDIESSADCDRVGLGLKTEISRCALDLHMAQECSNRLQIAGVLQNVEINQIVAEEFIDAGQSAAAPGPTLMIPSFSNRCSNRCALPFAASRG
jgi:hypothetical protein